MIPTRTLNLIAPAIIGPFGTICNCLAIFTLTRSQTLRGRNASIFLITIFVVDMIVNLGHFVLWIPSLLRPNITELYRQDQIRKLNETNTLKIKCDPGDLIVIFHTLGYALSTISYLTTAAFTMERVSAVFRPFKFNGQNQNKRAVIITIFSIIAISFSIHVPFIFLESFVLFDLDSGAIDWECQYAEWCIWTILLLSISIILPSNILLLFKVHRENQIKR